MIARRFARLMLGSALAAAACLCAAPEAPKLRLPDSVRPLRYTLDLKVVPADAGFTGTVDIEMELREASSVIWMHGVGLKVDSATVRAGGRSFTARPINSADFLGFETGQPVPAGKASLHVSFAGEFDTRSSAGLFKNKYGDDLYVASQFEATDARRAFPCFDEPGFKVPWQLTLHVPQGDLAFSNTPIAKETRDGGGMKTVRFAETKPLPSYLVAMAVGPYEVVDAGRAGKRHTPIRIITLKGQKAWAKWAVEATPPLFEALENYFGVPYPYEKLDHLAVPLFLGAMENPGLITYAQTLLVSKPGEETINFRRNYASVSAHEMAHQWFGDLVTLAWWDDTWLNEAFASWTEQKIVGEWKPEWNWGVADTASAQGAMRADSLLSARRIRQPIVSQNDIANAFDAITYNKGAAVIHMFENWAGPEKFRQGVHQYMEKYAFKNATAADFLSTISGAAGRDLAAPFSTFLDQPGVPLVSAALQCGAEASLAITQKRYLPLGSTAPGPETWQIPVCVRYGNGTPEKRECHLLTESSTTVALSAPGCPDKVLLNDGANGYYRSRYREDLLDRLLKDPSFLNASERLSLIGDTEALVASGDMPGGDGLRIAAQFGNDRARQVVSTTINIAQQIDRRVVSEELRPNFERFVEKVYGARARELGWQPKPDENDDTRLMRSSVVPFVAVRGDDEKLSNEAGELARKWLSDHRGVAPDMVNPVLTTAARNGDLQLWEKFYSQAREARDEQDRGRLLNAMSAFRDPAIVERNLKLYLSAEFDFREAVPLLFSGISEPRTRDLPFQFVKTHYDELAAKLPGAVGTEFRAQLPRVAEAFCDARQLEEVKDFFGPRSETAVGGPRILNQVLEQIRQCVAFRTAQQASIVDFLKGY